MNNNTISIIGYVGKYIRVKKMADSNNKVVKFTVGVREYSPNKDAQNTLWFDVDAWNGLGDRVQQLVTTGREIKCDGRLALNTYMVEKDGVRHEVTKPVIKLTSFYLCGKKPTSNESLEEGSMDVQESDSDDDSATESQFSESSDTHDTDEETQLAIA